MYTPGKEASTATRILVVRLGAMGDIIHTLPAVATLKHSFPGSRLTWIVEPRWACLLDGNPFVDRVILLDRHSFAGLRSAWSELRRERFDLAADFQGLVKSALVASLARPDRIFGWHRSHLRERPAGLFYSNPVRSRAAHIVDRNLELATAVGATSLLHTFPLPPGKPEGELPAGDFVLASPMAGWNAKQWPLPFYNDLARKLGERGLPLVLNAPPERAATLAEAPEAWPHLSGLGGLIHATRRARAIVGVDSGPLHLGAALAKPGVAIFGPTDPGRNGPYGNSMKVLRSSRALTSYKRRTTVDSSMLDISVEAVYEALNEHLARRERPAGCSA